MVVGLTHLIDNGLLNYSRPVDENQLAFFYANALGDSRIGINGTTLSKVRLFQFSCDRLGGTRKRSPVANSKSR